MAAESKSCHPRCERMAQGCVRRVLRNTPRYSSGRGEAARGAKGSQGTGGVPAGRPGGKRESVGVSAGHSATQPGAALRSRTFLHFYGLTSSPRSEDAALGGPGCGLGRSGAERNGTARGGAGWNLAARRRGLLDEAARNLARRLNQATLLPPHCHRSGAGGQKGRGTAQLPAIKVGPLPRPGRGGRGGSPWGSLGWAANGRQRPPNARRRGAESGRVELMPRISGIRSRGPAGTERSALSAAEDARAAPRCFHHNAPSGAGRVRVARYDAPKCHFSLITSEHRCAGRARPAEDYKEISGRNSAGWAAGCGLIPQGVTAWPGPAWPAGGLAGGPQPRSGHRVARWHAPRALPRAQGPG